MDKESTLNIVHAVLSLDCGGLERLVLHLCREGIRQGDRVTVLCLDKPGDLAQEVRGTGAEVMTLSRKPGLMRPGEAIRLRKILRELSPDVLHCHQMGAALYAGSMARSLHIPAILHTEHGNHSYQGWRRKLLASIAFALPHRLYCVSGEIADNLSNIPFVRSPAIQFNGIPIPSSSELRPDPRLRSELGIGAGDFVIGSVGRLVEIKRQERLVKAVAALAKRGRSVHLLLVGDGACRAALQNLAENAGIGDRVHFTGFQMETLPYLNLMDIFVLSSDSEGMPMALLEAWAAKKPVVASAVGGLPDLISEGSNGMLFPPEDQRRLTELIEMLMDAHELRTRLGENGHAEVVSRYSATHTADAYRSAYLELLNERGAAGLFGTLRKSGPNE